MAKKEAATNETGVTIWKPDNPNQLLPPEDMGMINSPMSTALAAPEFMDEDKNAGMAEIAKLVRPYRTKVTQDKRDEVYRAFPAGAVILTPMNVLVAENEQPFWFVPLFHFSEYCQLSDYRLKGTENMILDRSFDPNCEIARLSRLKDTRIMPDPKRPNTDMKVRNVEYLTFLSIIVRTPGLQATPVAISFSRGEYGIGQALAGLLQQRRPKPMFGCVFEGRVPVKQRHNSMGDWYGIDMSNPTSPGAPAPWVMERSEYDLFKALHYKLAEDFKAQRIVVDRDDDVTEPADAATAAEGDRKFG